jgi:myo-inositol 2-dehydrogenase/D-chiro-inositol 1-dehydrogenase
VGCGGRGTQAGTQLLTGSENVELVGMGDIFEDRLEKSLATIRDGAKFPDIQSKVKVDPDHHFVGFDAYKKILASDIDIVMLCTRPVIGPCTSRRRSRRGSTSSRRSRLAPIRSESGASWPRQKNPSN